MSINGTLFTGGFIGENTRVFTLSNCAYRADAKLGSNITVTDCVTASPEELAQLDENGVPYPENPACDRGLLSQWTDAGLDASRDAAGNPRIANGAMDVGCYEADWKGVYSAVIDKRGSVEITNACAYAQYKADINEVRLPEDGFLEGKLVAAGTGRYEFPVRVTGGELVVSVGGAESRFLSDGVFKVNLAAGEYDLSFAYAGEGDAHIGSGGRILGSSIVIR
jgi:hypothetical protein